MSCTEHQPCLLNALPSSNNTFEQLGFTNILCQLATLAVHHCKARLQLQSVPKLPAPDPLSGSRTLP